MSPKHSVTFLNAQNRSQSMDIENQQPPRPHRRSPPHEQHQVSSPKKLRSNSNNINYFRPAHSEIRFGRMRFLITDRPNDLGVDNYIQELTRFRVKTLVRVCEPTYNAQPIQSKGVDVQDWEFVDGQPPPEDVIDKWLQLCATSFQEGDDQCVAVHCVAGLGRAPVLVAIALLEAGMKCDDAVLLIRSQRRGALNEKQLVFLKQYKSGGRLRKLRFIDETKQHTSCSIM